MDTELRSFPFRYVHCIGSQRPSWEPQCGSLYVLLLSKGGLRTYCVIADVPGEKGWTGVAWMETSMGSLKEKFAVISVYARVVDNPYVCAMAILYLDGNPHAFESVTLLSHGAKRLAGVTII